MKLEQEKGLILALDLMEEEEAMDLADQVIDYIDAIKINYPLVLSCGIEVAQKLKERFEKPIIADFKIADIPVTSKRILEICSRNSIDAAMIQGFIGPENLEECVQNSNGLDLFAVTELTNEDEFFDSSEAIEIAEMAKFLSFDGVQAPGTKPERVRQVREVVGPDMQIICCGIGFQGGNPKEAIEAGADFEMVGRAIYTSDNPRKEARRISSLTEEAISSNQK